MKRIIIMEVDLEDDVRDELYNYVSAMLDFLDTIPHPDLISEELGSVVDGMAETVDAYRRRVVIGCQDFDGFLSEVVVYEVFAHVAGAILDELTPILAELFEEVEDAQTG